MPSPYSLLWWKECSLYVSAVLHSAINLLPSPVKGGLQQSVLILLCLLTSSQHPVWTSGCLMSLLTCFFHLLPFNLWHIWHFVDPAGQDLHPVPEVRADAASIDWPFWNMVESQTMKVRVQMDVEVTERLAWKSDIQLVLNASNIL